MKYIISIILYFLIFIGSLHSAVLLETDYGARPISMGGSYVAIGDDPVSLFWNPAGIPEPKFYGIVTIGYQRKLSDMNMFELFGTSKKYLDGYWGIGFVRWGAETEGWDIFNESTGTIDASEYLIGIAHKRNFFGIISVGATLKYDYNRIDDNTENAVALDIGARSVVEGVGIGFVIKNIGLGAENIPIGMVLGGSYTVFRRSFHTVLASLELSSVQGIGFILRGGAEYNYRKIVFFRLGYNALSSTRLGIFSKIRMGAGVKYLGGELSYSFLPYGKLGYTHEVNITYNLDNIYSKKKVDEIKPSIKLISDKNLISGIGANKNIIFNIEAKDETSIRGWEFMIKDSKNKIVYIEKEENLENVRYKLKQIEWAGESIISKKTVADGKYIAEARVIDYGNNSSVDTIPEIYVYRSEYAVIIGLNTDMLLKGDILKVTLLKKLRLVQKGWRLIVKDKNGNIINESKGEGIFRKAEWNGKDSAGNYVSSGKYMIQLEITFSNNEKKLSQEKVIEVK